MYCGTNQTLKIKLDAAHTTNALPWAATAIDSSAAPTASNGVTNGTSDVTVVAATKGLLKLLLLRNADTVAQTVSIIYDDNSTQRLIAKIILAVSDHLELNSQEGVKVYDSTGAIKQSFGGIVQIANGGTGATTAADARTNLGLGDAATKTVDAASGVAGLDASSRLTQAILLATDKRASVTPKTLTSSSNVIDYSLANGNAFMCNLGENTTLNNPSSLVAGQSFIIFFKQNGGNRTIAYGNKYKFPGGTAPTASTADNAFDALVCETYTDPDDSNVYILADLRKGIA